MSTRLYREYKFKFYLNANHYIIINGKNGQTHPHTWEFVFYIMKSEGEFVLFNKFEKAIEEYLEKRTQLRRVFMLVDFRIKPTEDDLLMYNFLKYYNLPVTIIATKADKIGGSKKEKCLRQIMDTIDLVVGDDIIVFSSVTKLGREEVLKKIQDLLEETI